jgi:hypothetical protein
MRNLHGHKENTLPVLFFDAIEHAQAAGHKENTPPVLLFDVIEHAEAARTQCKHSRSIIV